MLGKSIAYTRQKYVFDPHIKACYANLPTLAYIWSPLSFLPPESRNWIIHIPLLGGWSNAPCTIDKTMRRRRRTKSNVQIEGTWRRWHFLC